MNTTANLIDSVLKASIGRIEKAKKIADLVRNLRAYRWVGIYDVGSELVSIIAYSGPSAPTYPQFPISKGLTGSAVREKKTVVVGDVRNAPGYLTAFGSTLSEIIIPVLDGNNVVIGTIDVESERENAFSEEDQRFLEACARKAQPLWQS
jgi:L-methionine (R)-S-oxide reductase